MPDGSQACEAGELVLRRPCRELTPDEIVSAPIQDLIGSMFETMRAAPGVGLAAPQIGMPLQIAVIEDRQEYIDKLPPEHSAARLRSAVVAARHHQSAAYAGSAVRRRASSFSRDV